MRGAGGVLQLDLSRCSRVTCGGVLALLTTSRTLTAVNVQQCGLDSDDKEELKRAGGARCNVYL